MSLPQSTVGKTSLPIQHNVPEKETLWQQTYLEAFHKNYDSAQRWTRWKEDHEHVKASLASLPDKLSHEVVIPFGSKALMKGKLVHTNEILTCIGSSYFIKQSAKQGIAMCDRRIKQSEEMLKKLEDERTLLSNRQTLPKLEEAFASDDTREIIEEYHEEAEAEWRRQHREREADYRRKLSELRKRRVDQPPLQTEEDMFRRLDELELEEELNDELERLHAEYEADYENNDEEGEESTEDEEDDSEVGNSTTVPVKQSIVSTTSELTSDQMDFSSFIGSQKKSAESSGTKHSKAIGVPSTSYAPSFREAWGESSSVDFESVKKNRRISFADEAQLLPQSSNETDEVEDIYIRFSHSQEPAQYYSREKLEAASLQEQDRKPKYLTPADIYKAYKTQFSPQPKSILKKSSSYPDQFQDNQHSKPMKSSASFGSKLAISFADSDGEDCDDELPNYQPRDLSFLPPVLCDVQESATAAPLTSAQESSQRPVSRFKQARQKRQ